MNNNNLGNGLLLGNIGGVPPSKVVIIGAGTVAEFAARSALGLGAQVEVFDNSLTKLRNLQHKLQFPIATSTIQPKNLLKSLIDCDVAIGALRGKTRTPVVVTESMVEQMKDGAVVIDVSIDNGGSFETSEITTHSNPTMVKHGVIHYCVPNVPSRYSRTASVSISNIFTPYLLNIGEMGGIENAARFDKSLQKGMYFYHGILTNKKIADWFNLPMTDINLLIL
jgi:alanine dehydrogenase